MVNILENDEILLDDDLDVYKDILKEKKYSFSREEISSVTKNKRVDYLMKNFFKSEILLGRVSDIKKERDKHYTFIQIVVPKDINRNYKLDNKNWMIYCNLKAVNKEVADNLKYGDLIYFRPKLNLSREDQIIEVMPKTVRILVDYKEFLKKIKIDPKDVYIDGFVGVENQEELKIWASEKFYDSLTFLHEILVNTLKDKSNELSIIEKNIEERFEKEEYLKEQLEKIEQKIEEGKRAIEEQNKKLEFWGFERLLNKEIIKKVESQEYTTFELIKYLRKYLFKYKDLKYSEDIIRRFLLAIKCNELIILSGPSGTGKTSLINGFSEAVGGESKIISVKPSWTDTEDLIGFYNPIEQSYVPTPFLDAIVEAKKVENNNKLYLICLDEMNIAHVEYYFAEFLSKLELDKGKRVIELYSEETYKDILREIIESIKLVSGEEIFVSYDEIKKWCDENNKNYSELIMAIRKKVKFIEKYPARFEIPENIRFVGTMNIDHTTKVISPKVIDRSFIIELTQELEDDDKFLNLLEEDCEKVNIDLKQFSLEENEFFNAELEEALINLNNNCLIHFSSDFNYRSKKHMKDYFINGSSLEDLDLIDLYSDILYIKILPRLNYIFKNNDERLDIWKKLYKELVENVSDDVKRKIQKMDEFAGENKILSFWSVY